MVKLPEMSEQPVLLEVYTEEKLKPSEMFSIMSKNIERIND
eukprot:CAMPEP_0202964286 /NCGR_PEP_ID=MMETSP1396-20130829/8362_1 /ASSEMBLY_ACC=CAM_ASM_000872 /TAXON_ID= /ORGANISM="Pseudokeronopsis sp., Strain Brazil" /LENGTH=40 /DNA_ID= /DNA_START= /DNA_END= /DNA_ORIENTATION=